MKQPSEYKAFANLVSTILSISNEEIMRREAAYRVEVEANPKRRGPKRGSKRKPKKSSASPSPVGEIRA